MKSYICENCGTRLNIDKDGLKATCPACGNEYFITFLETAPIKNFLLKIACERSRKNTSRASDLKTIASQILAFDAEDEFANFYVALAEKMFGRGDAFQKFVQEANYNAELNKYNMQMLRDIISECDKSLLHDVQCHIKRVLTNSALVNEYLRLAEEVCEKNRVSEGNYALLPRDVFVCHSDIDSEAAEYIVDELVKSGYKAWISSRNIRANSPDYWVDIEDGINACSIMLVISSEHSMSSRDCAKELDIAGKRQLLKIEYKLDSVPHNEVFAEYFGMRQWIKSTSNYRQGVSSLIAQVKDMLEESKVNKKNFLLEKEREELKRAQAEVTRDAQLVEMETFAKQFFARAESEQGRLGGQNRIYDQVVGVKIILSKIVAGDIKDAKCEFAKSVFSNPAIAAVVQIALTLAEKDMASASAEQAAMRAKIKKQAADFRTTFPVMQDEEKALYLTINNSDALAYLCFTFLIASDNDRFEFVQTLLKPQNILNENICRRLITVFFKMGKVEKAMRLLEYNAKFGGKFALKTVLECVLGVQEKLEQLKVVMTRYAISDDMTDELNDYLLSTDDSVEVMLQVVRIMAKNNLKIKTDILKREAFSTNLDFDGLQVLFECLKGKSLGAGDVDNLIDYAVNGGSAEIINATVGFVVAVLMVKDIGADNVKKVYNSTVEFAGAEKILIYSKLCESALTRNSKEEMVKHYFNTQSDDDFDILSIAKIFATEPSKISLASYEKYLFEGDGDMKAEIVQVLAKVTNSYSGIENILEKYSANSQDSVDVKSRILTNFAMQKEIGDGVIIAQILFSHQKSYNDGYVVVLDKFLKNSAMRADAEKLFYNFLEDNADDVDGKVAKAFAYYIRDNFDKRLLASFIKDYTGDASLKGQLIKIMIEGQNKIKKIVLEYNLEKVEFEVNIAEAYAIFSKNEKAKNGDSLDNCVKDEFAEFLKGVGCTAEDKLACKRPKGKYLLSEIIEMIK